MDYQAYRAAAFYLKNSMSPRGYDIHVSAKYGFKLEQIELTRYMQRTVEHPELKTGLGHVLWDWLLNFRGDDDTEFEHKPPHHQETVHVKLGGLRGTCSLSIIADAGSTVSAAIRALLDLGKVPIRPRTPPPKEGEPDERDRHCRLITPHIITNALSIATMVSESRHATSIGLTLIGGRFQPDLSSISGDMTDQCLRSWGGSGTWKSHLAIIGTTGCWAQPTGSVGFACEDLDEARLKATLLDMAFFRVIIMHSSKLTDPPAGNIFAPLSSAAVDLLVIDDGNSTGARQAVSELSLKADKAGVAVLTLKTQPPKPGRKT